MKKSIYLLIISMVVLIACSNDDDQAKKYADYPSCVQNWIGNVLDAPPHNPRATIEKYNYQGSTVYVFNSFYPDASSGVYNEKCESICSLGGINGNKNDTCIDWESAQYIETVWEDER